MVDHHEPARVAARAVAIAEALGGDRVRLVARAGGEDVVLTELDGRFWTAEVTASFTGRVVGLFATEGTLTFTRFRAEGTDAVT